MKRFLFGVAVILLGSFAAIGFWQIPRVTGQSPTRLPSDIRFEQPAASIPSPTPEFTPEELANIRVYEVANESVVNIDTSTVQYDRFFMLPIPGEGSGSGSVLDREGHILTNNHVIEDARQIEVTLASGNSYPAELVGTDSETDIAVLRINAPPDELSPVTLGNSENLKVGQRVYALGNPFGLAGTLTTGIISSLNRTPPGGENERSLKSLIQTDAAMNPGNSGGPLLDTGARVIGMNIAIASKTGQNAGVGFAIPVDRIRNIVPQLIKNGKVVRPYHGIVAVMETDRGLKIVKLNPGGPAEAAGLRGFRVIRSRRGPLVFERIDKNSDIIQAVDDHPTKTHTEFLDLIERYNPGDTVHFTILRDSRRLVVPVTLGSS
jgi:S1-C subfamily serine protease